MLFAMTEIIAYNYYSAKEVFNTGCQAPSSEKPKRAASTLPHWSVSGSADGRFFVTRIYLLSR